MALAEVFESFAGPDAPVEFVAYDGSHAGAAGSPVKVTVRSPVAVAYLAQAPGALGLARAYVAGHLDVDGDMYDTLARMTKAQSISMTAAEKLRLLRALGGPKLLVHRMPPPPQEVSVNRRWRAGRRHSKRRDAHAISHHYDVSNRFYEWVLGPSMAYTCAVYPHQDATLEEAQAYKFDLVARKLGLREGMRLLDVGCGWGGMVMHAAREYGVKALGVTLSAQQAAWAQAAIEREGLSGLAEVRHLDYRDVPETGFDAVSSIGLTEHIGKANLPSYFAFLFGKLKAGGRLLNHCITRPDNLEPPIRKAGLHQPVRLPRRRAGGTRLPGRPSCTTPVLRCGTRRTCASTTPRPWRPGAPTWTRTGKRRSPRSARAPPGCGGCTWPAPASGSTATTSSCTRCCPSGWRRTGPRACRFGPTGSRHGFLRVNLPNGPCFSCPRHRLAGRREAGPAGPSRPLAPADVAGQPRQRGRATRRRRRDLAGRHPPGALSFAHACRPAAS